jgi:SAM-dependent methyltransferase/uncharacterized protein YbaR (Trm112 family)
LTQRELDLAASIQSATEEIVLRCVRHLHRQTGRENLCLAGDLVLNGLTTARILRDGPFQNVWIQPAAGDAGAALGTVLFIWRQLLKKQRDTSDRDLQQGSLLGPTFSDQQIRTVLDEAAANYTHVADDQALCEQVAGHLADGKVVAWFQGPMEFGPRALGCRSILADPRDPTLRSILNLKVKYREEFRPFAPAVLKEFASEYFQVRQDFDSPYGSFVAMIHEQQRRNLSPQELKAQGLEKGQAPRSSIPAVTDVDFSSPVQTVDPARNRLFYDLIQAFYRTTGCPLLLNADFSLNWEPVVCSPTDALKSFMSSEIDVLCMGHFVLCKSEQRSFVSTPVNQVDGPVLQEAWACPSCSGELAVGDQSVVCRTCSARFPVDAGIPQLFWPHETVVDPSDVTDKVKAFYEETPFPNYDDHDTLGSLLEKSRRGIYANRLNEAVGFNCNVLEVGCGTGQLSNFLGHCCRRVIGADLCLNSLKLAEGFRQKQGLSRVRFVQMNLFRPCFRREQFDVILCNGVLHHTSNPYGGFQQLVPLLRPGGHIVIGLYNRYGRLMTDLRRNVFRLTRGHFQWIDSYLRSGKISSAKRRAWFADQYLHPHESKHTMDEVLGWFEECGLEFCRGVPATTLSAQPISNGDLFDVTPAGSKLEHLLIELGQIVAGSREGGFFLMIGRKPAVGEVSPRAAAADMQSQTTPCAAVVQGDKF